jgi:hypothetical protein
MAVDKLVDSTQLDSDLTAVANAIRTKGGTSTSLAFPTGFVNAIDAIPTGGGGSSPIQLLGTVTVPSDIRAVSIDTTPYNSYDFYFCIIDATLTASDWLYILKNGSSPSGGQYQQSSINHHGLIFVVAKRYSDASKYTYMASQTQLNGDAGAPSNMYVYTYVETKLIKAGSTFKIYGGNYADM